MLSVPDFHKKQLVFVFANEGEKLAFRNDNLIVKTQEGKIKFQCTCYRLFIVYIIGHFSITSPLIMQARKFGFYFALMSTGFRLYALIGAEKDGNTLLKKQQYLYDKIDIAQLVVKNKIFMQYQTLSSVRKKTPALHEGLSLLKSYYRKIDNADNINSLMAYEGLASKCYFRLHFDNVRWNGRKPRIKPDAINCVLDIGYTLLFAFVESILGAFGFDLYVGVLHRQFYMRKSLVCDMVEPFRPLIDHAVKKGFNLGQIKEQDFICKQNSYSLKYECSPSYISLLMTPIIQNKDEIFCFIQAYYRCFMKHSAIESYPFFTGREIIYGAYQL